MGQKKEMEGKREEMAKQINLLEERNTTLLKENKELSDKLEHYQKENYTLKQKLTGK